GGAACAPRWASPNPGAWLAGRARRLLPPAPARAGSRLTLALVLLARAARRLLRLGVALALLLGPLGPVDQLEHDQGRAIAGARARMHDERVAAVALAEASGAGVEALLTHLGVGVHAQHLPPPVQ